MIGIAYGKQEKLGKISETGSDGISRNVVAY